MTFDRFLDSMNFVDSETVEEFVIMDMALLSKRQKKFRWIVLAPVAACLIIAACLLPFVFKDNEKSVYHPPITVRFQTFDELKEALPFGDLYSRIDTEGSETVSLELLYESDENGEVAYDKLLQLEIKQVYVCGEYKDTVSFYILFDKKSVAESTIPGYEEQGRMVTVNNVDVHFSFNEDDNIQSHAKFVYDGSLYVIDVVSDGWKYNLVPYIEKILGDIHVSEEKNFLNFPSDFDIRFEKEITRGYPQIYDTYKGIVQTGYRGSPYFPIELNYTPDEETLKSIYEKTVLYDVFEIKREITEENLAPPYMDMVHPYQSYKISITITAHGKTYNIKGDATALPYTYIKDVNSFFEFSTFVFGVLERTQEYQDIIHDNLYKYE